MAYGIRDDYQENAGPAYFLDDPKPNEAGAPITFQPDVYAMALLLADLLEGVGQLRRLEVLDLGCGWSEKLVSLARQRERWHFRGVDFGPNIDHCRDAYARTAPNVEWLDGYLETVQDLGAADVVICSDVIEHLADPRPLLATIRRALDTGGLLVLSTPERDVQHGYDHLGPSPNLCHVREWNAQELCAFLSDEGLAVVWQGLTRGSDQGFAMATQLVIARLP